MRILVSLGLMFLFGLPQPLYAQTAVKGRIIFDGTPPPVERVEVKSDVPTCGSSQEVRKIVLGTDGGVSDAIVKIIGTSGTAEPKKGTLDQVQCKFVPHVQVLPVGSVLTITSSDAVLHNSHGFYEDGSTAFNIAVPIVGMEVTQKLAKAGVIKLRCDAGHTWMSAYISVTDAPHYALTDADGNFTLEGIPAGQYEIEVWHEWLGEHREPLVVTEGETAPVVIHLQKS